ncbi:hypothetical protein ACJX0J_019494, partial [Zea mays]
VPNLPLIQLSLWLKRICCFYVQQQLARSSLVFFGFLMIQNFTRLGFITEQHITPSTFKSQENIELGFDEDIFEACCKQQHPIFHKPHNHFDSGEIFPLQ